MCVLFLNQDNENRSNPWSCLCSICMCAPLLGVRRKWVVCPGTRTGTLEVFVGSYDSALQHQGRKERERRTSGPSLLLKCATVVH